MLCTVTTYRGLDFSSSVHTVGLPYKKQFLFGSILAQFYFGLISASFFLGQVWPIPKKNTKKIYFMHTAKSLKVKKIILYFYTTKKTSKNMF